MRLNRTLVFVSVAVLVTLTIIVVQHATNPSIGHLNQPRQIEIPIIAPTPARPSALATSAHDRPNKAAGTPAANWDEEFRTSKDYFSLIAKAAKAALNGDGRAAYYVSMKELECLFLAQQYGTAANPEETFNQAMAARTTQFPPEMLERKREQFRACAGFYKAGDAKGNDVFANLPPQEGGYRSNRYWMALAYQYGDPLAQIDHAGASIGGPLTPNHAAMPSAQADINQAIGSGDPEAIYRAGILISNGLYVETFQGYALMLAACDLGYDCTAKNPQGYFPFGDCAAMGMCQAGSTVSDWIAENIGAEGYAKAYARAQQIKDALTQGDTRALQQFAKLKD